MPAPYYKLDKGFFLGFLFKPLGGLRPPCGLSKKASEKHPLSITYSHSELIVKYNIGLKTLLQQGISEPVFYGGLVYKFKRIAEKSNISCQFKQIVKSFKTVGHTMDIM